MPTPQDTSVFRKAPYIAMRNRNNWNQGSFAGASNIGLAPLNASKTNIFVHLAALLAMAL